VVARRRRRLQHTITAAAAMMAPRMAQPIAIPATPPGDNTGLVTPLSFPVEEPAVGETNFEEGLDDPLEFDGVETIEGVTLSGVPGMLEAMVVVAVLTAGPGRVKNTVDGAWVALVTFSPYTSCTMSACVKEDKSVAVNGVVATFVPKNVV
jgi:hypothetical protein